MLSLFRNRRQDNSRPPAAESTTWRGPPIGHDKFAVVVGLEETEFVVDTEVLIQGNNFFETKFILALTEEGQRVLRLPHSKADVSRACLLWAYCKKVTVIIAERARQPATKTAEKIKLEDLYDFASCITDVTLQNAIINAFLETLRVASAPITAATLDHLWGDQDDNPLRDIVVLWFMAKPDTARYSKMHEHQILLDFFIELALMYAASPRNRAREIDADSTDTPILSRLAVLCSSERSLHRRMWAMSGAQRVLEEARQAAELSDAAHALRLKPQCCLIKMLTHPHHTT